MFQRAPAALRKSACSLGPPIGRVACELLAATKRTPGPSGEQLQGTIEIRLPIAQIRSQGNQGGSHAL